MERARVRLSRRVSRRELLGYGIKAGGALALGGVATGLTGYGVDKATAPSWAAGTSTSSSTTLVVAAPGTPDSLDLEFNFSLGTIDSIGALYDYLLGYATIPDPRDPSVLREDTRVHPELPYGLNLRGKLAEKWAVASDGRSARFTLRQGIKSNWGNELTANDVKWTWERHLALKGLGAFQTAVIGLHSNDQVRADGKYIVSFHVDKPNPLLLKQMVNLANPIYDSTKLKQVATPDDPWAHKFLGDNSAGFGPYTVKSIVRGQQAVFEARSDYYGKAPFFKTVIFKEVPQSANRLSLLEGGAVDIAQFLLPLEYTRLKQVKGVRVDSVAGSYLLWIELNAKVSPFDKSGVRQAMNYAFPHQEVLKTVFYGLATELKSPIPIIYPMATEKYWTYNTNLDTAKQLLQQAGVGSGLETTLAYNAGDAKQEPIAILFQTNLAKIGVKVTLKKLPADTFFEFLSKRTEPMIFYLDSPWVPDPGYATELYFQSKSFVDFSNYVNPEVDTLIAQGLETVDIKTRQQIYDKVQRDIMGDAPWVFIASPDYTLARRSDIKGYIYYTQNNLRFQDLRRG